MDAKEIDWSQWDHLLGTMPDTALAEKIGTMPVFVRFRRLSVGAARPRGRPARAWTAEEDALLADKSKSCEEIAKEIGDNSANVSRRRKAFGLNRKPGNQKGVKRNHSARDAMLREMFSRMTRREVADELGVSRERVRQLCNRLGVTAQRKKLPIATGETIYGNLVLGMTEDGLAYKLKCSCGREWTKKTRFSSRGLRNCGQCSPMERRHSDEIGKKHNRLTIRKFLGYGAVECDCDCGTKGFVTLLNNVLKNMTKSCGCRLHEYWEHMHSGVGKFVPRDLSTPDAETQTPCSASDAG